MLEIIGLITLGLIGLYFLFATFALLYMTSLTGNKFVYIIPLISAIISSICFYIICLNTSITIG